MNKIERLHIQPHNYWIFALVIMFLIIIVWAKNIHTRRFYRLGKSLLNIREFYQVVREEYSMTNNLSIGLVVLFVCTTSLFIYQGNRLYPQSLLPTDPFYFFTFISLCVLTFFLLKILLVRLLGILFLGNSSQVTDFVYNIFLVNLVIGIVLVPIVIGIAFIDIVPKHTLFVLSCWLLAGIYAFRLGRTFIITTGQVRILRLYFFAYLCTLEIIPFIVIFKLIEGR